VQKVRERSHAQDLRNRRRFNIIGGIIILLLLVLIYYLLQPSSAVTIRVIVGYFRKKAVATQVAPLQEPQKPQGAPEQPIVVQPTLPPPGQLQETPPPPLAVEGQFCPSTPENFTQGGIVDYNYRCSYQPIDGRGRPNGQEYTCPIPVRVGSSKNLPSPKDFCRTLPPPLDSSGRKERLVLSFGFYSNDPNTNGFVNPPGSDPDANQGDGAYDD